jgi:hypothetical protein
LINSKVGRVRTCFNPLDCYKENLANIPLTLGVCRGIVTRESRLWSRCKKCKWMNKESQSYIETQTCCACSHFECPYCGEKECVDDTFDGPWISYR